MRSSISASILPLTLFASRALAVNLRRGGYDTSTCTTSTDAGALSDTFPTPSAAPVVPTTTSCTTSTSSTPPPQADMGGEYISTPAAVATTGADTAPSASPVLESQQAYGALPYLSASASTADPAADSDDVTTAFIDMSTTVTLSDSTTSCVTSTLITVIPTVSVGYSTVQTVIPFTASYNITSQQVVTSDVTIVQTSFSVMVFSNSSSAAASVGADSLPTVPADPYSTPAYTGTDSVLPTTDSAGFDNASASLSEVASTPTDVTFASSVLPTSAASSSAPVQQMSSDASHPTFGTGAVVAVVAAFLGMGFL